MLFSKFIYILYLICFIYCALSVFYLFILSLSGRLSSRRKAMDDLRADPLKKIAVLLPDYRKDGIILSTAGNLLELDYPAELYTVFIIADSFQKKTLEQLRLLPLTVHEVTFDKSSNTKS